MSTTLYDESSAKELRLALEQERGTPVSDYVWERIVGARHVATAIDLGDESEAVEYLAVVAGAMEDYARKPSTVRRERVVPPDRNLQALRRIMGHDAAMQPSVVAFRREVLRGRLLKPSRVTAWIERRAKTDGEPTMWVTVPMGAATASRKDVSDAGGRWTSRLLEWVGDERSVQVVKTRHGGALDRLRGVAGTVAERYGWSSAHAARFVLTGEPPGVTLATVTRDLVRVPFPAAGRITMNVSSRMTPDRVRELFLEVREESLAGSKRVKPISEKHAELAVFAAEHRRGMTWAEAMRSWNRQHPPWFYDDKNRFTRDSRSAYRRVTGEKLGWQGVSK